MKIVAWIRGIWNRLFGLFGRKCRSGSCGAAVVCVGMEHSRAYGACPGARVDLTGMAALLKKFTSDTDIQGPATFLDAQATRQSVARALEEALEADFCIFYYSGHGGQGRDPKGENGVSEFLCLDDGPLPDYKIWEMLQKAKGRVFMIFDCCHSATMFRSAEQADSAEHTEPFANTGFTFQMLRTAWARPRAQGARGVENLLVWSGCPANDYSYGDATGGVLTNGIRNNFRCGISYDDLWMKAERAASSQNPVRTRIGAPEAFSGEAFR